MDNEVIKSNIITIDILNVNRSCKGRKLLPPISQ